MFNIANPVIIAFGTALVLGQAQPGIGQAQPEGHGVSLRIETHDSVIRSGEALVITATLRNDSDKTIHSAEEAKFGLTSYWYKVDVSREDGAEVPMRHGEKVRRGLASPGLLSPGSMMLYSLAPGQTRTDQVQVSGRYDLSRPGIYDIQVKRKLPESLGRGYVSSNKLKVTVVQ